MEGKELNRIEKRAIEALAVAPLIRAVSQRIGRDEALFILKEVNQQEAFQRGRSMAEKVEQNGIEALVDEVAGWGRGGLWEMDVLEQTPTTYFFNVTRCPYYEKYRELELDEFGVYFSNHGYSVAIQDVRGQNASEGEFEIWAHDKNDGYDKHKQEGYQRLE